MKTRNLPKSIILVTALVVTNLMFIWQVIAQTVVTNPSSPWTVPGGVTSIKVEVWGGGGAGGGAMRGAGGGGGGGAYNTSTYTVSPGQSYAITYGSGGLGALDSDGGNGNTTTFSGPAGSLSASGGSGGTRGHGYQIPIIGTWVNVAGTGGNGATGTHNGGDGGNANEIFNSYAGGGGGGAGSTGNGGNGSSTSAGSGGSGTYPGGNGGNNLQVNGNGYDGNSPAAGGGGGRSWSNSTTQKGGDGAAGQVILTYTVCNPPAPTVSSPVYYCLGATAVPLTATGSNLLWYTQASGGSGSSTAPTPSTASIGTTSYWVSQTVGCESPRAQIDVIVVSPVVVSTSPSDPLCKGGNTGVITITAGSGLAPYQFSVDNGGNYLSGGNPFPYPGLSANTQYLIRVKDANGCESPSVQ